MKVIFLGASGQCGRHLLNALLKQDKVQHITLVARRTLPHLEELDKKIKVLILGKLQEIKDTSFAGHNCAITTMGIGKASTSEKDELMHVDCELNVEFADRCKKDGIEVFGLLSALGADITETYGIISRTGAGGGWYNHVKGKCQEDTKKIGFKRLSIFRPAGIIGNANTGFFNHILPKLDWLMPMRYNSIKVQDLGKAMANRLRFDFDNYEQPQIRTFEGEELFNLFK